MALLVAEQGRHADIGSAEDGHLCDHIDSLPSLTTTVPREYVHRASLAEVFLTGCRQIDDSHFSLTGQWPRTHTFFTSADGTRHDPLQVAETMRQAGLYLAHSKLGVPLGYQFVLWDLSFTAHPDQLGIKDTPSELSLDAVCTNQVWRRGRLAEFSIDITIWNGGLVATGGGHFTCIPAGTYQRLRRTAHTTPHLAAPASDHEKGLPAHLGRTHSSDVVLAPTERPGRWLLSPDVNHPILFDHAGDHIPGMVLLEAARQAACGILASQHTLIPASASIEFCQYAEFNSPCWVEAALQPVQHSGQLNVQIAAHQDGRQVFAALIAGPVIQRSNLAHADA